MKILAVILARKNSKRLKNKHHLKLGNKSLINHTFDLLKKNLIFENIIVSTDDEKILNVVKKNYSQFIPFKRPDYLSRDSTNSFEVLIYVYNWYTKNYSNIDGIFLLQPTSPFRTIGTIRQMIEKFKKYKMKKSIVAVNKIKSHPEWMFQIKKNKMEKYIKKKSIRMSQYLQELYIVNGLGYLIVPKDLINQKTTIPENSLAYICKNHLETLDIDNKDDLEIAKSFKQYFKL